MTKDVIRKMRNEAIMELLKQIESDQKNISGKVATIKEILSAQEDADDNECNDEIFLLSIEEYEKYKDLIPKINCWWWLRTSGNGSYNVASISCDGSVYNYGYSVHFSGGAVRPAMQISNQIDINIGDTFNRYDFLWIRVDRNLAIAEMPIAFRRFDENSNDYETSEIREFLLAWKRGRE